MGGWGSKEGYGYRIEEKMPEDQRGHLKAKTHREIRLKLLSK